MNVITLRFAGAVLAIALGSIVFALVSRVELVKRVEETIDWLLKVSFFDFVKLAIFIKPWKAYARLIGIGIWLVLAYIVGRYMIVVQPKISEIPGPYIPMIGYLYYLSLLFVASFVLRAVGKGHQQA